MDTELLPVITGLSEKDVRRIAQDTINEVLWQRMHPCYGVEAQDALASYAAVERVQADARAAMEAARVVQNLWVVRLGFWWAEYGPILVFAILLVVVGFAVGFGVAR